MLFTKDYYGSNLIILVTKDDMQSFKIVAKLLLGSFWLVKKNVMAAIL